MVLLVQIKRPDNSVAQSRTFKHLTLDDLEQLESERARDIAKAEYQNLVKKGLLRTTLKEKDYCQLGYIYFKTWEEIYCYLDEVFSNTPHLGVQRLRVDFLNDESVLVAGDLFVQMETTENKNTLQVHIKTAVNGVGTIATLQLVDTKADEVIDGALDDFSILARNYRLQ